MAAERLAALHALAAWLETQPGASAAWQELEVADYGEAGFGFRAAVDIAVGSVLCSIPVRLAFSALAARVSPALGPLLQRVQGLRDDDVIALLLMHERALGRASPRWAHVASLPQSYDATVFWSEAELAELQGSPLFAQTAALQAQLAADYAVLQDALLAPHPALFPPAVCGLDAYRWAVATIWSRAMDLPVGDGSATMRVVVPWADLCNNDGALPVCHAHERCANAVVVLAGRAYSAGEQVNINYGLTSASAALRLHGFLPPSAPVEVPVYAAMSPEADLYAAKRRLLDGAGVPADTAHALTAAAPLPAALLLALRAQRLTAAEIAGVERAGGLRAGVRVSAANERAALSALQEGLTAMLEAYRTTADADDALLADADASLPPRRRAAVALRLGEKRVLHAALAELAQRLRDVDAGADATGDTTDESSEEDAPAVPAVEESAVVSGTMAAAKAPEAAAALAAYFESLLQEEGQSGEAEGGESALDSLD